MEAVHYGIRTSHASGEFSRRGIWKEFFITFFETPFLYESNGEMLVGKEKEMMLIPPGIPVYHGPTKDAEDGFINHWIYLKGEEISAVLEKYPIPVCTALQAVDRKTFLRYMDCVISEQESQRAGFEDKITCLTTELLIEIYRNLQEENSMSEPYFRIRQARDHILKNLENDWTLKDMALLSGYSPSRFSALYQSAFGVSPKQDLLNARIRLAEKMLTFTNATVTEAASACGFHSIYYFSKYFKKATGKAPSDYIRQI